MKQIADIAQRVGPGLELKFRNGYTRIYLNEDIKCRSDDASGCIKFQLAGYFPEHDIILIEVDYWEGVSWRLVRADAGRTTEIVAPPHYSPDRRWLVSVASGEGPSGPPNGMDIVPSVADPSLREWHYRTPDNGQWLYEFTGWKGNNRVELLASSLRAPQRRVAASITRRNGEWRFAEP